MQLDDLLRSAVEHGASDLHLKAGASPFLRIDGRLTPLPLAGKLTQEDTLRLAEQVLHGGQREQIPRQSERDVGYQHPELGRFRVNVFFQRGAVSLVFRINPAAIPSLSDLNLPPVLEGLCEENRGLILVTGTTSSGKSTTLAALIDRINRTRTLHILTIEDPIEFVHQDCKSLITQREIRQDTESFAGALRAAMRQDPDVIMVGEIRDRETVETALQAAETGHLVLSTLHTLNATETINRIISLFPPHQQGQIRMQLAAVLRAILSQRLIRAASGSGRLPAVEVLINTEFIRNCIVEPERTREIHGALSAGGSQYGMQTFDQSLLAFYNQGRVTLEEVLAHASSPEELKLRVRGVLPSSAAIDAS
ncbi:MAG: type IV pilus twitching motility protein PilT [Acidobacteria bacterium]|nr:type IV pilus twitching motility protein PilT [Acidobacteriota bacterium]